MFGMLKIRARLTLLELDRAARAIETAPAPTIEIPVLNSLGEPVADKKAIFAHIVDTPKMHTVTVQQAFDMLQEALGVQIALEQGTDAKVTVFGE